MNPQTETEVLQHLLPELEAEGYEVYLHPNRPLLPAFLGNYVPDAIALRADKNIAIEIVDQSLQGSRKLERIARIFGGQEKWELRVVLAAPVGTEQAPRVQTLAVMQERVAEIRGLALGGHLEPALLLGWATLEALARAIASEQFERAQTPSRLVEILAKNGYLTPSEADDIRKLAEKRNRLLHGELQGLVSRAELERFASVLETMLRMVAN